MAILQYDRCETNVIFFGRFKFLCAKPKCVHFFYRYIHRHSRESRTERERDLFVYLSLEHVNVTMQRNVFIELDFMMCVCEMKKGIAWHETGMTHIKIN